LKPPVLKTGVHFVDREFESRPLRQSFCSREYIIRYLSNREIVMRTSHSPSRGLSTSNGGPIGERRSADVDAKVA
jgi:hypothetical protein